MKESARYVKIVEWSDEEHCYIGTSPGLMYGGCHGDDEKAVYAELCDIVEEIVELYRQDDKPLPPATAGNGTAELVFERHLADRELGSRDNLNKDGLGFSGGFRWSFGGILCPRAVFRMLRLLTSPHRGLVADLAGPPAAHRENLGALSPRQQVSRLSAVSRLPSPNSSARRSVFFARPR